MVGEKGSRKTGGRKKGTPNKVNREVKEKIKMFVTDNFDKFQEMWEKLDDENPVKFNVYLSLIKLIVPTPKVEEDSGDGVSAIGNTLENIERGNKK